MPRPTLFRIALALVIPACAAAESTPVLELANHQPFPIRMPLRVRLPDARVPEGQVQRLGDDVTFIAEVAANERRALSFAPAAARPSDFHLAAEPNGVRLRQGEADLGRLTWGFFSKLAKTMTDAEVTSAPKDDFAAAFVALPLSFRRRASGPVCEVWSADALTAGLRLQIELVAYRDGFLDLNARLVNEAATKSTGVYAAVVARWEQPAVRERLLCNDNRVGPLDARAWSTFRRGEGRHLFQQRGVDWVEFAFAGGSAAVWQNAFAPSFTVLDPSSRNTFNQPRYYGANVPQLGQEVQTAENVFYSVTEIARANIRSYRDRLAENVLPARGDGVSFTSRLAFGAAPWPASALDQMFVAYAGYDPVHAIPGGVEVSFGVPSVRFATAYFPYSTFGENFDALKMPGMDRDAFWPLAGDTLLKWREFADDIRRDVRLIKAMGFQLVRLHHLELLAPIPAETRREYLDFLFGELRHVGLKAMLDVYAAPASIADLVKRHHDVIDAVELENETLIWGIPVDRPAQWRETYAAIKQVAPQVKVNLTGYNNTGIFDRLTALDVPFDRVGLHSYVDSLDALPSARGWALALGSYAAQHGKEPVITEWNWRGLTRLTPEARAKIYPQIFAGALATRAIPELHQFQFNETLAPNPRSGRGNILRHYEFVHLSRRPKLEAFELLKLIEQYADPRDGVRRFAIAPATVRFDADGVARGTLTIKNQDRRAAQLRLLLETTPDVTLAGADNQDLTLPAGGTTTVDVTLRAKTGTPGFYYCFARLEENGQPVRYGWIEARLTGRPKFDAETNSAVNYSPARGLELDVTKPCTVVYGANAPALEVETAIAIAETLESASGLGIEAIGAADLTPQQRTEHTLIYVGTPSADPTIASLAPKQSGPFVVSASGKLAIGGAKPEDVETAGMDFILRYWKFAKDSGARRVGLTAKELPRGFDPTKLP